jgi:hypothetical protein
MIDHAAIIPRPPTKAKGVNMKLNSMAAERTPRVSTALLARLLTKLSSRDGLERQHAREELVELGEPALAVLIPAIRDERDVVRWEAAKAIGAIRSPNAAFALVNALEDENADVRWLAAEGLIHLGDAALRPLLRILVRYGHSAPLLEGAHHVLRALYHQNHDEALAPVIQAIERPGAEDRTPIMAYRALRRLRR